MSIQTLSQHQTHLPILTPQENYWPALTRHSLQKNAWSVANISHHLALNEWEPYLNTVPRDPYVESRWKQMLWLYSDDQHNIQILPDCPMAQGGQFNDASTMADKLRFYPAISPDFLFREDVQQFIKAWIALWDIAPYEPILFQINGIKGMSSCDPLQGQGIHQDGSRCLSVLVISRQNVAGGENTLFYDKAGTQLIKKTTLSEGEILHVRDHKIFHNISTLIPQNLGEYYQRFVIIINSRFNDPFQKSILQQHAPYLKL